RDIEIVENGEFLSVMKKSKTKTWGLAGGQGTEPSGLYMHAGTPSEKRVGTYRFLVKPKDRCVLYTAGGGGYGDPKQRPPETVLDDVVDSYVSIEKARDLYGVSITDGKVDWQETRKL